VTRLLQVAAAALGLAYVGARFHGPVAVLDNLSNFPVHFGLAFIALALLFALLRRFAWMAAAAAAAAIALAPVVPWYFGRDAASDDDARPYVRLLVSNVYYQNHKARRVRDLVAAESPDVVGLVEVTSAWLRRLKSVRDHYPYRFEVPDEQFVGLALYSRFPLEDAHVLALPGEPSTPAIAATLKAPGGNVQVILAHPMSPESAEVIERRNAQILAIARYVQGLRGPVVVAGDFNITMWNTGYRPLVETAGLHNARQGYGVGPTWPAPWQIGVPIDQILGTRDVHFRNFRVLDPVGSDHLPISAEFSAH
jgi:endonuclease/exonuclease/phosphatase (EEP) superfamily protein YafD